MIQFKRIKPCPFCGGKAHAIRLDNGYWYIGCLDDCLCIGNINNKAMVFVTRESAIEAWNRRVK